MSLRGFFYFTQSGLKLIVICVLYADTEYSYFMISAG